jgi:hypothetical protein
VVDRARQARIAIDEALACSTCEENPARTVRQWLDARQTAYGCAAKAVLLGLFVVRAKFDLA